MVDHSWDLLDMEVSVGYGGIQWRRWYDMVYNMVRLVSEWG